MATTDAARPQEESLYDRLVELVFSGGYEPGAKLTERELADELQVSRIPVRESLAKMVAQGLLLGGGKREGVRMRKYMPDEIRQLYEFRQFLEVGAARAATKYAVAADIERLEAIAEEMDKHVGEYGSIAWAKLDQAFHEALVQASHNRRAIQALRSLLTECQYVFYLRPSRQRRQPTAEEATAWMNQVQHEHHLLVEHLAAAEADGVEEVLYRHLVPQRF